MKSFRDTKTLICTSTNLILRKSEIVFGIISWQWRRIAKRIIIIGVSRCIQMCVIIDGHNIFVVVQGHNLSAYI